MATTIVVRDESTLGTSGGELTLEFLTERISVRELIRGRVYQEVTEYNARHSGLFRGLVQPRDRDQHDQVPASSRRRLDWEAQFATALRGFRANGFLLLVDDTQVTDLDQEIVLRHDTTVTFLRLVPLIGG